MNRMSASDWTLAQDGTSLAFCRGFTGHEHYGCFGIINMNARLYDPVLGRFFSPDPQVQSPFSTQGFNRYSYCGNNPVMYVDEDGEFAWFIPLNGGWTSALTGGIMGSIAGGTSAYAYATSHNINPWTGRPNSRIIVIGRDMGGRVNPVANVIEAETISSDWNSATNDNFRGNILEGKQFNRDWIQLKIEQGYAIFDIGEGSFPVGYNYGMELRYLQGYPSVYPTHIVVLYRRISIIYYNGPTTY